MIELPTAHTHYLNSQTNVFLFSTHRPPKDLSPLPASPLHRPTTTLSTAGPLPKSSYLTPIIQIARILIHVQIRAAIGAPADANRIGRLARAVEGREAARRRLVALAPVLQVHALQGRCELVARPAAAEVRDRGHVAGAGAAGAAVEVCLVVGAREEGLRGGC